MSIASSPRAVPDDLAPRARRHRLPAATPPERRSGIPLAATLAPVVVSLLLWAVTRSVYSLMFAALGPVVALGGLLDARLRRRRQLRRETTEALAATDRLEARVRDDLDRERERLEALVPSPAQTASMDGAAHAWSSDPTGLPVRIGRGTLASGVELDRDPDEVPPPRLAARRSSLESAVGVLRDAAVVVDATAGIGVIGPAVPARALARSVAVQLGRLLSPESTVLRAAAEESWAGGMPHRLELGARDVLEFRRTDGREVRVAWAESPARLPPGCGTVVRLDEPEGASVQSSAREGSRQATDLDVEPLALTQAVAAAARLREIADRQGLLASASGPPPRVALSELVALPAPVGAAATGSGLPVAIGHDGEGPVVVDLVHDGPHAIVGGTSGSGKSELLVSWVLALARSRSPERVTFLLIDFKGGASFTPLFGLPHVVGVLSDLDVVTARRATASLRAEVLRRERWLADRSLRSIDDVAEGQLARLVVVVDEFAALLAEQPELHELVADLAARGRSLGLHLILCTQRPAGAIREAVLANAPLRIALRMTSRADSDALLGSPDAARLPVDPRGRALLSRAGEATLFQVAVSDDRDPSALIPPWPGLSAPRRPWADPLPASVRSDELDPVDGRPPFCLVDEPEAQRVSPATFDAASGSVLVVGRAGSGTTTALAALAHSSRCAVAWLPTHPGDAWAVLDLILEQPAPDPRAPHRMLVVDDLDSLLDRWDDEHRVEALQRLGRLAREGGVRRLVLALSVKRIPPGSSALVGAIGSRVLLGMPSKDEHLLAGGASAEWIPARRPGSGRWRDREIQIAVPASPPPISLLPVPELSTESLIATAIVTTRPRELGEVLAAAGIPVEQLGGADRGDGVADARRDGRDGPRAVVGDVDSWLGAWALLTRMRRDGDLLFDRCTTADLRAVTRSRQLPPPLDPTRGEAWRVRAGGAERVRIGALA